MTGENFKRINRKNSEVEKLKEELENARVAFTNYSKAPDEDSWSFDELYRLQNTVINSEYNLYCARYEDNRRRNWR
ncbi:hypothetical protein [Paenibacillus sp. NAIST15-1]|uniref:hypothetical protein n=1 Tax=Paenibacillus sp. NAIST15-1 TaxID=1605994 RepID=UPI00086F1810|nr:hypothetical protein [Paenibacillus sp. NAIST15-1]GAV11341.1 hypothetical protein PBN151_1268 [Paenibacillus sp. NAIST15-1]